MKTIGRTSVADTGNRNEKNPFEVYTEEGSGNVDPNISFKFVMVYFLDPLLHGLLEATS